MAHKRKNKESTLTEYLSQKAKENYGQHMHFSQKQKRIDSARDFRRPE